MYRGVLRAQPYDPDATYQLGVLGVSINKSIEAIPLFKLAVETNPQIVQFWLSYIDALIKLERFDEAKRILVKGEKSGVPAEKLEPLREQTQVASPKVKINTEQGSIVSREQEARDDDPAPSLDQINRLKGLYQANQLDEAEKIATSLTQQFPNHALGWQVLGVLLKLTGRLNESLLPMQKSVDLSPQSAETHSNLGVTLQELGRLEEAEASFRKAIALKPDFAGAHDNLGNTLKELGRLDEAEASHRMAIALEPDYATAFCNLANTLMELGRLDGAEASYKEAIAMRPDYSEAHSNLGITLQKLGRIDEAEASCRRAIALKSDYAEAHCNLGVTLQKLARMGEAEASYREAIALKPDYAEAHCNLGNTLKELGRLDEAETSYGKAIALKPDYVEAHSSLGATYQKQGRLDEAEASYRQAVHLKPDAGHAAHMLCALTGENTAHAPLDYVESLFDGYAARFDSSLVGKLNYRIPKAVAELIAQSSDSDSVGSVLDLGCGTGLFGIEISQVCNRLEGLDISENMLRKAEDRGVYHSLVKQDIESYLLNESFCFNYFVATDVFVYIGDLTNVFQSIQARNKSSGRLVFSVEHKEGHGFALLPSGRYAHSKSYIESLCERFHYKLEHFEAQNLRLDRGSYIRGALYYLSF